MINLHPFLASASRIRSSLLSAMAAVKAHHCKGQAAGVVAQGGRWTRPLQWGAHHVITVAAQCIRITFDRIRTSAFVVLHQRGGIKVVLGQNGCE